MDLFHEKDVRASSLTVIANEAKDVQTSGAIPLIIGDCFATALSAASFSSPSGRRSLPAVTKI